MGRDARVVRVEKIAEKAGANSNCETVRVEMTVREGQ